MRGRKPKPTALKAMAGTLRKDRTNLDEPRPELGIPDPPEGLDARAMNVWNYYAPRLAQAGVLAMTDRDALLCYCSAVSRRAQAEKEIAKGGMIITSPNGHLVQSPWLPILNKATEQMLKFGQELGLSPSSRTRIKATPPAAAETGRARFFKVTG